MDLLVIYGTWLRLSFIFIFILKLTKDLEGSSGAVEEMLDAVEKTQREEIATSETTVAVYEVTTTESRTTLSQSEQRKKEKDEVLSFAASLMEKLRQVDKQLETTLLDSKSVSQIQARSHLISTQISSMMDAVRMMTDLNDDNQYLALVKVCCCTV